MMNRHSAPATVLPHERIAALTSDLKHMVDQLAVAASSLEDRAAAARAQAASSASSLATRAGTLIQDHPLTAISVAFGVGYLAMRLLRK